MSNVYQSRGSVGSSDGWVTFRQYHEVLEIHSQLLEVRSVLPSFLYLHRFSLVHERRATANDSCAAKGSAEQQGRETDAVD